MKNRVQTVAVTVLLAAAISTAALVEFCSIFIGYRILRGSCWLLARHVSTLKEFSVAAAAATAYFNPDIEPGAAYKVVLGVPAVLCYASVALAICWLSDREGARAMDKKRIEDRCAAKKDKAEQRCVSSQQGSKRKKRKKRKKGKGKGREQAATPLTIFVRDLCSKTVAVYMAQDARTTVADLKILICEKTNVPAALQSLAFSGKRAAFADGALLADCSIGCGSTVTLMLAGGLCGGMGCGPSKPSSDDGSAYREGVTLISVLKVYEASEVNKEVKKMVGKIKEQMREMQANATYMEEHGTLPPALAAASVDEAMEAIGSLVVTKVNLEVQVEETIYTVMASGFDIEIGKGRARELLADLDTINTQLAIATALFTGVWKLELPPQPKEVTNRKKFKRLPLANAAGALSQLAVIGWVYLNDAAKGVEAKDEYVEYVVVPGAAVEKGCSVRLKPEEGRVQTVATWHDGRGRVVQKVRCADLEPGVVGRVDKLWQGGKGGDCVVLPSGRKTSNTFPKDKLEVVTKVINPSIKAFLAARVDKVEALTLTIVIDIESYGAEFAKQLKAAQPNTMEEVAAAVQQAVKGAPSKAEIANLTADPEAPPPEQIEYGAYMQRIAGPVSIGLYLVVTQLIASTPNAAGAYCVPGPVKGLRRMVAKTIAKYTSFANCRDLARCTVQVPTLDALAAFLKALVDCKQVTILRIKNRFADDYDPLPAGGYRDVQVLLLLPEGGGTVHRYAELQINLEAMVKIKNGKGAKGGGGHDAFNLARAIDAFSPRTLRYQGNPNDDVWQSMKVGGLLEVDFQDSDLSTPEVQKKLTEAIRPAQCRVRELTLKLCMLGAAGGKALAAGLQTNKSIATLKLGNTALGPGGGKAIAAALAKNTTITTINLAANTLGPEAGKAIAAALAKNTTIITINLELNALGPEAGKAIAAALTENTTITNISLFNNGIGPGAGKAIAAALAKNMTITTIQLGYNNIGPEGGKAIAAALTKNTTITSIQLGYNNIGPGGGKAIAAALTKNTTITSIKLSNNRLGPEGGKAIAAALTKNTTITSIELRENNVDDDTKAALKAAWGDRNKADLHF